MFDFVSFIPRAIVQGIPLLFGSTGETLTEKSGNLNLGIPGIMYVGGICGVIGAFLYEHAVPAPGALNPFLAILIPLLSSLLGSLLMGLLYCFLTVTLRANQNVTGLAMTTFGVGFGNFFGGSLIKLSGADVPSIALSRTSAFSAHRSRFPASSAGSARFSSPTVSLPTPPLLLRLSARISCAARASASSFVLWAKTPTRRTRRASTSQNISMSPPAPAA